MEELTFRTVGDQQEGVGRHIVFLNFASEVVVLLVARGSSRSSRKVISSRTVSKSLVADLKVRTAAVGPSTLLRLLEMIPGESMKHSVPLGAPKLIENLFLTATENRGCHAADQRDVERNSAHE